MGESDKKGLPDEDRGRDEKTILPTEIKKVDEHTTERSKLCRWCDSPISTSAKVCSICKGNQKWFWNYFGQILLVVSTCISIILVCISVANVYLTKRNLDEAKEEKIKAREALAIAQSATTEALKAQAIASAAQAMLDDLSSVTDVNIAAISASHDVRALRKLWAMSHSTNTRIRVIAEKQLRPILSQLRADHEAITSDYWGFKRKQDARYYGLNDMENWKRVEYVKNYLKVPLDRRVVYVMQFLSDEKETDEEKLAFSYSILQIESKPDVIYTVCAFVSAKAKLNKDYLFETGDYMRWLKDKYGDSKTSKAILTPDGMLNK
jgi:uncharacterized protein (UPF0333 family)